LPKTEEPTKPTWLEELSRKQAHRKSGMFTKEPSKENLKENNSASSNSLGSPSTSPFHVAATSASTNSANVDKSDNSGGFSKPMLPVKPSQIREDGEFGFMQIAYRLYIFCSDTLELEFGLMQIVFRSIFCSDTLCVVHM
jgi:hypothetical protein